MQSEDLRQHSTEPGSPPGAVQRLARAVRWNRVGTPVAVVTLGFSQIFYTIIGENLDHFPLHGWFHLWVLVWVQILPLALVLAVDAAVIRIFGEGRAYGAWRALLLAFAGVSLLRQVQVMYPNLFWEILDQPSSAFLLVVGFGLMAFALCFRYLKQVEAYAQLMGVAALGFVAAYALRTNLWGPAWLHSVSDAPSEAVADGPPVFLLVFDELAYTPLLKDGKLDAESYPHFAALAGDGAWFTNASTNDAATLRALPCILTGKTDHSGELELIFDLLPPGYQVTVIDSFIEVDAWIRKTSANADHFWYRGRIRELSDSPLSIAEYLRVVAADSPYLESPFQKFPFTNPHPFKWDVRRHVLGFVHQYAERELEFLLDAVDDRRAAGRFVYWHGSLPHTPFLYDAEGNEHGRPNDHFLCILNAHPHDPERTFENYKLQVKYVDTILGGFVNRLKDEGLYDQAIIVVTGDHGIRTNGMFQHERFPEWIDDLCPRVPLIVRAPGMKAGTYDLDYQHQDLVPTLLDLLEVPYEPDRFEGVSVLSPNRPERRKLFTGTGWVYEYVESERAWKLREKPPKAKLWPGF